MASSKPKELMTAEEVVKYFISDSFQSLEDSGK